MYTKRQEVRNNRIQLNFGHEIKQQQQQQQQQVIVNISRETVEVVPHLQNSVHGRQPCFTLRGKFKI